MAVGHAQGMADLVGGDDDASILLDVTVRAHGYVHRVEVVVAAHPGIDEPFFAGNSLLGDLGIAPPADLDGVPLRLAATALDNQGEPQVGPGSGPGGNTLLNRRMPGRITRAVRHGEVAMAAGPVI